MKKVFLLLIFPFMFFSQNNMRFTYRYDFAPNEFKKDSLITNYMRLDTNGFESNFYNEVKFKVDSIKKTSNDMGLIVNAGRMDRNLNYYILKNYSNREVIYSTKFTTIDFRIPETEIPVWKLDEERKLIGSWNCQKAITYYKGRNWIAYFTSDIPVNDGPYKFWGLPGFIVEIFSEDKSHKFSLIQIEKIENPNIQYPPKNAKTISYEKYREYLRNYKPTTADIFAVNVNNGVSTYIMKDGNRVNIQISKETLDKYRDNRKELSQIILNKLGEQNSNPIER